MCWTGRAVRGWAKARYTVEIQARWTAEAMEEAYRTGLREGGEGRGQLGEIEGQVIA